MPIRSLDPLTDRAIVDAHFTACADYIRLERDADPGPQVTQAYFTDAPPGSDPADSLHLGLFDPALIGIAELSFGFPTATDAYIGLLLVTPAVRGTGAGARLLRHLETTARARGAIRLYLGVLDINPRGRAFWDREGFTLALANRTIPIGTKTHLAHRLGKTL